MQFRKARDMHVRCECGDVLQIDDEFSYAHAIRYGGFCARTGKRQSHTPFDMEAVEIWFNSVPVITV